MDSSHGQRRRPPASRRWQRAAHLSAFAFVAILSQPAGAESPEATPAAEVSPRLRLREADAQRMRGDYAGAAAEYEALRGRDATRVDALCGLVRCKLATGDYTGGRALLDAEADTGERSGEYHYLCAEAARSVGRYDEAIEFARTALKIDSRHMPARLVLCETLEATGKREEALVEYEWFERLVLKQLPIRADDLTAVGKGFYRYSSLARDPNLTQRTRHVLNKIFQAAYEQVDRTYWPARVAAADLLREKFNVYEATDDYVAALEINTNATEAHVGLGRLALEDWAFENIDAHVQAALDINTNSVAALNLRAAGKLLERKYRGAAASAEQALAVNPNDLEAIGLQASAMLALSDTPAADALIARGEKINACSNVLYDVIADTFSGLRRFEESETYYRKAIECEPTSAASRTELGMMYMQWGDESKARDALEGAWKLDPFNDRTKNTLELLDRLDRFAEIKTDRYIIRYDAERDEIIAGDFARCLDTIYDDVCRDFNARLERPTTIEIFPSHMEFGVRIHGKPWIHTIGACTGWVIAMDAPRIGGDLTGPYNFADVLRHEFTHTVTLAVTRNRIPHWFTEGLAVFEEPAQRSYDWMRMLADTVRRDELYTLESIDWGFMRPMKPNGRLLAYAQSEWMCEYIVETYGYDAILRMLALYGEGKSQPEVFKIVTGDTQERFDERFAVWAKPQVKAWGFDLTPPERVDVVAVLAQEKPGDADAHARLARAQLDAESWNDAMIAAKRCLKLDENHRLGMESFVRACGHLLLEARDGAERIALEEEGKTVAERLLQADPRNRFGLSFLASLYYGREAYEQALPLLTTLHEVWPIDPTITKMLADIHNERREFDRALPLYLEAIVRQSDDAQVAGHIAAIYERTDRLPDARHWYLRALDCHPLAEEYRQHLAEIDMRTGDVQAAIEQYQKLCKIAPHSAKYHADCALAYRKVGDQENMRKYARRAVELDRNSPAAALLDE